ncbi:energy-coupling factor transporter transmembrane component T family protein [Desulfobacter latus]|uniref:Energy-coupling factor transporter transmembrane protein EcfT n=1 Tax=Desulfobacter latus TaxID=2292 RepID=A0A850TEW9_9BACT|nr:energy-coupling factor transporter transmembrane component T [Desulfobacter latus]NWH06817.1 energy-coupling factor transporter transmembrane protein EcfT [Desulfobacter latus]
MTLFSYHPGDTLWHTLDVRCKCLLMCLLSLAVLKTGLPGNIICLCVLMGILKMLGVGPVKLVTQLKCFLLLLTLIFFCRWAVTPGHPMVTLHGFSLTRQGFASAGLVSLRFLVVMLLGLILTVTTRSMEIKAAVQWFFKPVPFIPEKRVAVMVGLALKFMPLILDNAREVTHAVNARCGNLRKNPVRRLVNLAWPLLKKTFQSADDLSLAMQARCYSENRTDARFFSNGKEGWVVGLTFIFCAGIVLMG